MFRNTIIIGWGKLGKCCQTKYFYAVSLFENVPSRCARCINTVNVQLIQVYYFVYFPGMEWLQQSPGGSKPVVHQSSTKSSSFQLNKIQLNKTGTLNFKSPKENPQLQFSPRFPCSSRAPPSPDNPPSQLVLFRTASHHCQMGAAANAALLLTSRRDQERRSRSVETVGKRINARTVFQD